MTLAPERPQTQETPNAKERSPLEDLIVHVLHPDMLKEILSVADLNNRGIDPNSPDLICIEIFSHRLYPSGQFSANRRSVMNIVTWVDKALRGAFRTAEPNLTDDQLKQRVAIWWFTPNVAIKFDDQYDDKPRTPYDCLRQQHELLPRVIDVPGQLRQAVTHIS
jgi:hypothetical protein